MPIYSNETVTPRESLIHEWDVEQFNRQAAHDLQIHKLKLEVAKAELKLRQEDATKARKHQESMKELELEIRAYEAKWSQLLRIPVLIVKLPLYLCFGIAFIIATARNKPIDSREFWAYLK